MSGAAAAASQSMHLQNRSQSDVLGSTSQSSPPTGMGRPSLSQGAGSLGKVGRHTDPSSGTAQTPAGTTTKSRVGGGGGAGFPSSPVPNNIYKRRAFPVATGSGQLGISKSSASPTGLAGKGGSPTFKEEPLPPVTLGDHFTVQAKHDTLREFMGEGYWSPWIARVCDGKLVGVAVRYTGQNLVMMQFRDPTAISKKGKRYPFSLSLPQQYLVPVPEHELRARGAQKGKSNCSYSKEGALPFEGISSVPEMNYAYGEGSGRDGAVDPKKRKMCVVCGYVGRPGEMRPSGFKCHQCVGKSSDKKLRDEAQRQESGILARSPSQPNIADK